MAILQTLSDAEMASPNTLNDVLLMLQTAFECPKSCLDVTDDQQPRITLLLLEHLQHIASHQMRWKIEETKLLLMKASSTK